MRVYLIILSCLISSSLIWGEEKVESRKQKRIQETRDLRHVSAVELEKDAMRFIGQAEFEMAIRRYRALTTYYPDYKADEELMAIVAALEFKAGNPDRSLRSVEKFGRRYPDSLLIARMVELAYALGQRYAVEKPQEYKGVFSNSKMFRAFEYVNEHDPYSVKAAEGLYTMAYSHISRNDYEEAVDLLLEILKKQPNTDISARAEIRLGECYLGLNKAAEYSREFIDRAIYYLEGYKRHYPKGVDMSLCDTLLKECYRRKGYGEMKIVRFYCTQRKWTAAKLYLGVMLEDATLTSFHEECRNLLKEVDQRRKS